MFDTTASQKEDDLKFSLDRLRVDHQAQAELVGEHTRQIVSLVDRQKAMKSTIALLQMQVELLLHERDQREHERGQPGRSEPLNVPSGSVAERAAADATASTRSEQATAMAMQLAVEAQGMTTSGLGVSDEQTAWKTETSFGALKSESSMGVLKSEPSMGVLKSEPSMGTLPVERIQCLSTLEGHAGVVHGLAALPEGRLVSCARRLMVWHLHTRQRIRTMVGHEEPAYAVTSYGTDGLASASRDQTVKLWDTLGGENLAVLRGHRSAVVTITSIGMGRVATGSADKSIKIWGITSHRCLQTLEGHKEAVKSVAALDASTLGSGSADGTVKFWDLRSRQVVGDIEAHEEAVSSVIYASGHCVATASADCTLKLWDLRRRDCLATLKGHNGEVHSLTRLGDRWIASSSADNVIKVWEIAGCRCRATLQGHTGPVLCLTTLEGLEGLCSSGNEDLCFASCSEDRMIKIWGPGEAVPS